MLTTRPGLGPGPPRRARLYDVRYREVVAEKDVMPKHEGTTVLRLP